MSTPYKPEVKIDFAYQPSQKKAFVWTERGGGTYLQLRSPQTLEVGGQRSGKTLAKLIHGVQDYCLRFENCSILVLRRTRKELDEGVINDFHSLVPSDLYDYNKTDRVATFRNGSRVVFGYCATGSERDIEKYLGTAYAYILVDECSQFSPTVWERLLARNTIGTGLKPDERGNFPIPRIVGCTNPIGAWWSYYKTVFIDKRPWEPMDKMRRAKDGSWWAPIAGENVCIYDPANYFFNHSTVLDNKIFLTRNPHEVMRLKMLSPGLRRKFLEGYIGDVEGQFFDCWTPEYHVVNLREDPEAIIWQPWQPVIGGQDWGVGHHNAFYLFTKALVRHGAVNGEGEPNTDYRMKTVCFAEIAPEKTGLTSVEFADLINAKAYYPRLPENHPQFREVSGQRAKVQAIFFSHEKFNRVMEAHSPADEYSRLLRERKLPPVSPGTRDRVGSSGHMYNELKLGRLVILSSCQGIIQAIPTLVRDPKFLDDVVKTDSAADDRYDGFRLGLYGLWKERGEPAEKKAIAEAAAIEDPFAKYFFLKRKLYDAKHVKDEFRQPEIPAWAVGLQK